MRGQCRVSAARTHRRLMSWTLLRHSGRFISASSLCRREDDGVCRPSSHPQRHPFTGAVPVSISFDAASPDCRESPLYYCKVGTHPGSAPPVLQDNGRRRLHIQIWQREICFRTPAIRMRWRATLWWALAIFDLTSSMPRCYGCRRSSGNSHGLIPSDSLHSVRRY